MATMELNRLAQDAPREKIVQAVNALTDALLGNDGAQVKLTGHDGVSRDPNTNATLSSGNPQLLVRSAGGVHAWFVHSSGTPTILAIIDAGVTLGSPVTFNGATDFNAAANFDAAVDFNAAITVDAGATFATGQPVTGNGTLQFKAPLSAAASSNLSLTTTPTNVPGASVSLTPGIWKVTGTFYFVASGAGDVGAAALGQLATTGGTATIALSSSQAVLALTTATVLATISRDWLVTVTATTTANLQASKNTGTGASICGLMHTTITATNA